MQGLSKVFDGTTCGVKMVWMKTARLLLRINQIIYLNEGNDKIMTQFAAHKHISAARTRVVRRNDDVRMSEVLNSTFWLLASVLLGLIIVISPNIGSASG